MRSWYLLPNGIFLLAAAWWSARSARIDTRRQRPLMWLAVAAMLLGGAQISLWVVANP